MTARLCSVDGCAQRHMARSFCENHYRQHRAATDPVFAEKQRAKWRRSANRRNAVKREQAQVYKELLELGKLP